MGTISYSQCYYSTMQPQIGPSSTIEAIGKYVHVLVELVHLLHEDGLVDV